MKDHSDRRLNFGKKCVDNFHWTTHSLVADICTGLQAEVSTRSYLSDAPMNRFRVAWNSGIGRKDSTNYRRDPPLTTIYGNSLETLFPQWKKGTLTRHPSTP